MLLALTLLPGPVDRRTRGRSGSSSRRSRCSTRGPSACGWTANLPGGFDAGHRSSPRCALGAIGVALAVALARIGAGCSPAGAAIALLVAVVALIVPLQTQYALSKYVNGAGSKAAAE